MIDAKEERSAPNWNNLTIACHNHQENEINYNLDFVEIFLSTWQIEIQCMDLFQTFSQPQYCSLFDHGFCIPIKRDQKITSMASTEPNYFQGSITCIEKAYSKQTNIHTKTNKQKKKTKKERKNSLEGR